MRKIIIIAILLCGPIAFADWAKVTTWMKNQNYTKAEIDGVTRDQLRALAINRGIEADSRQMMFIMSRFNIIRNDVRADWRDKRIEAGRIVLENKVHEYDPAGIVRYMGQEPSVGDPAVIVSVYAVKIDLNME